MIRSQLGGLRIKFTPFFSQSGLNLLPRDARHIFVKRPFAGQSLLSVGVLGALSACGVGVRNPTPPQDFAGEARPDNWPPQGTINFGDDSVKGAQGDDRLEGGNGDDEIDGDRGDDLLMGDSSSNPFSSGDDTINGGEGNDEIDGGNGDDKIDGGEGDDRLTGGSGDDTFTASEGMDVITDFGTGDDVLQAGVFSKDLGELGFARGTGADNYYDLVFFEDMTAGNKLTLERAFDVDETLADWLLPFAATSSDFSGAFSGVTLEYDGTAVNDNDNTVVLATAGVLFGFGGDDTLTGSGGDDYIFGGNGSDTINGGDGDDILNGGDGDDEIDGGIGNDELNGGNDDDTLKGGAGDDTLNGGGGDDTLNGGDGNDELTGGGSSDTFVISEGSDTITDFTSSFFARDRLDFSDLIGMSAVSNLRFSHIAGSEDLQITFTFSGGDHTTTLQDAFASGRPLRSHYDTEAMTANIFDAIEQLSQYSDIPDDDDMTSDDGKDTDSFFKALAVTYGSDTANHEDNTITLAAGVEDILYGFGGDDELTGNDDKDNKIFGGDGEDTINGGGGADTLYGGNDSDTINGGADADTIYGGDGADTIDGGAGNDNLYGGGGSDTFFVSQGSDIIHDFALADELDFSAFINATSTISDLSFNIPANSDNLQIVFTSTVSGTGTARTVTLQDVFAEGGVLRSHYDADAMPMTVNLQDAINQVTRYADLDSISSFFNELEVTYKIEVNGTATTTIADDSANTITLSDSVNDILYGFGGNDKLTGNALANTIYGGDGSDDIDGGEGNDNLYGGSGSDDFFASKGSDTIHDFGSSDDLEFENFNDGTNTNISTLSLADLVFTANTNDADDLDVVFNDMTSDHTITIKDILDEDDNALLPSSLANSLHTVISRLTRGDILFDLADFELMDSDGNMHIFSSSADSFTLTGSVTDTIYGLQGNDELTGNDEGTTIYGGSGNDTIDGGGGDDILVGGTGVDTFVVSAGSDTIADFRARYGGSRSDVIDFTGATFTQLSFAFVNNDNDLQLTGFEVGGAASTLTLQNVFNRGYAFSGNTIAQAIESMTDDEGDLDNYFDGIDAMNMGAMGDDEDSDESIDVTTASMTHFALGGDDTITVNGANDAAIYGGAGNDEITGGDGANFIHGGSGSDTINGGSDADILYGGSGTDTINGGDGNDTLDGGLNNDELDGGAGDDKLIGGFGNDELDGGAGDDKLIGGFGSDELDGGAGDDTLTGNDGNDTFSISTGTDLITDFSTGDRLDVRNVPGGSISFAVSNNNLVISGFTDSNNVAGMVTLMDVFAAEGIFYNEAANMGMGAAFSLQHALDVLLHNDSLFTGTGLDGDSTSDGSRFYGFGGDDTLTGTGADEQLYGGSGNDTITANGGVDDLYGGGGNDKLTGGDGNDVFHVSLGKDTITDFSRTGANNDILDFGYFRDNEGSVTIDISDLNITQSEDGDDLQITGFGFGNSLSFENILSASTASDGINSLQDFTDFLFGTLAGARAANLRLPDTVGTDGGDNLTATVGDRLYGFGGVDTLTAHQNGSYLYGGDGGDTLNGGEGSDKLFGGAGGDTIIGGAGNDMLVGGAGNDTLTGDFTTVPMGSADRFNNDTFVVSEGVDTITDFYFSEFLGGERDILDFSNFGDTLSQSLEFTQSGPGDIHLQITGYGAGRQLVLQNVFDSNGAFDGLSLSEALVRLNSGAFANLDGDGNGNLDIRIGGVRNIFGTGEDDTLNGDDLQNVLYGGDGRDTLNGLAGDDMLKGGNHHDELDGGDGEDELFGEGGGDDLDGGDDDDRLTGGDGDDYFQGSDGTDTITDFQLMDDYDVLDFSNTNGGVETTSDLTASVSNGQFALSYDHDGSDNNDDADAMFVFEGTDFAVADQAAAEAILQQLFGNDDILVMNGNNDLVFL